MATSGSVNLTVTRDDIISEALQVIGVLEEGGTPNANQLSDSARSLNILAKSWMADGLHLWKNRAIVVFPVATQSRYVLKPSGGDRACYLDDYVKTEIATAASSGATSISVDSITDMAASDVIGVEQDDGTIHWTTISGSPSGTTITLASGLTDEAAVDNNVYTYTTAITWKPLQVPHAYTRTDDNIDIPVIIISKDEYSDLSSKSTATGRINQIYIDPQRDSLEINVWPVPSTSDVDKVLVLWAQMPFEDFDAASDEMDFPLEWGRALVWSLAADLAFKYGIEYKRAITLQQKATVIKENVMQFDQEMTSLFIIPDDGSSSYR